MEENKCPRCNRELTNNAPLYQCCRCFTYYCINCEDSNKGRKCPKCNMGPRLIVPMGK